MGDFTWPSGGPFLSHSLEPQYVPLISKGLGWGGGQKTTLWVGMGSSLHGKGGQGPRYGEGGSLGARGALAGLGSGAVTRNLSSIAVIPSCPFFPQSTRPQPRQVAASLPEPRCAWRVGHVWLCQL